MESDQDWSAEWKGSTNPSKQRKYRANAPYHQRQQFLSARLEDHVQDTVGTTSIPVRQGDRARIVRGDHSGEAGEIRDIDYDEYKVYIEGVDRETVSGSEVTIAIDPSNIIITKLNLDDDRRVAKYEMTEEEKDEISVEEEPDEEVEETADGEADETEAAEEEQDEPDDDADEATTEDVDYEALVDETVADVKDRVRDEELDPASVLEAEKDNKDRKTLVEWLENRIGDNDDE